MEVVPVVGLEPKIPDFNVKNGRFARTFKKTLEHIGLNRRVSAIWFSERFFDRINRICRIDSFSDGEGTRLPWTYSPQSSAMNRASLLEPDMRED